MSPAEKRNERRWKQILSSDLTQAILIDGISAAARQPLKLLKYQHAAIDTWARALKKTAENNQSMAVIIYHLVWNANAAEMYNCAGRRPEAEAGRRAIIAAKRKSTAARAWSVMRLSRQQRATYNVPKSASEAVSGAANNERVKASKVTKHQRKLKGITERVGNCQRNYMRRHERSGKHINEMPENIFRSARRTARWRWGDSSACIDGACAASSGRRNISQILCLKTKKTRNKRHCGDGNPALSWSGISHRRRRALSRRTR